MYSNKSEYGQRRPYSSRDSRLWDEEARREERREPQRNLIRDSYDKYSADAHNRADRMSSRDYSEPHKRGHSPDLKREWRRKSPVRKHILSPERGVTEKRRRTLADEDHYRYHPEPGESCRQSPELYTHVQRNKDFKRTVSLEESYSHKRTPEETRYSHRQDEFHYSQYQDEASYRRSSEYYTDRDSQESREQSQERTRARDVLIKSFTPPRQRSGSFSRDHEEHNHNRSRFSLNGSSLQSGEPSKRRQTPPPAAASAGETKMSKGFQRFLDVLNMGVNVETLTKIVTQGTPDVNVCPQSPPSPNAAGRLWSVGSPQRQQRHLQNTRYWPETERTERPASPPSRLYSSNGKTMSEERSVESSHFERKFLDSRTKSPSALVKTTVSPEEEHKHRQMQDVLQAIGINLEYEELGQMSSRIQERLYGKKNDSAPNPREEKERRRPYIPKHRSRSSSRSSSSSSFQDYNNKSHSYSAQREETDFSQTDRCSTQQSTTKTSAAIQVLSSAALIKPKPEPPPPIPSNPIVNCSPYTHLPPNFPSIMPNLFVPRVPPYLSYPQTPPPIPPVNMFPPVVPQSRPVLPPHLNFPQHPFLNLPPMYPTQPVNTNAQKAHKYSNRPRCLQVISTKEPG